MKGKEENILVVTDPFTHYAQTYVTWSQTTLAMAKALWDNFGVHYGFPKNILLDQGRNFKNELIADLCRLMEIRKLQTSPYHSQTNGQCERFNSTLIGMLGTLPPEHKSDWKGSIGALVHAYNCTQNFATGFSPYFLMYGRQPCLPIDVTLGWGPNLVAEPTFTKYIQKLRECIRWAHRKAVQFQQKEAQCHEQNYDKHSRGHSPGPISPPSRDDIKYKIGGETGNMSWNGSPIPTCQCMWYVLGMGRSAAGPYIGTTCYPSVTTLGM